ncbi:MAG: hypothetical protein MK135_09055 [Polyangiaceae bacterium]|nr:hypothetical protein [Polyangiaceae bacterium]
MTRIEYLVPCLQLLLFPLGCETRKEERRGAAPPPELTAKKVIQCIESPTPFQLSGDFCLEKGVDVRRYGSGAGLPLSDVCTELFNGECELYRKFGLKGVLTAQIAPRSGAAFRVSLTLSEFSKPSGAYGFFSHRVFGDAPLETVTVRPFPASGRAVMGAGVVYAFRGTHVAELTYLSESQTPQELITSAEAELPGLARSILDGLGGAIEPPAEVTTLEGLTGVSSLGVRFTPYDIFGIKGLGSGAVAEAEQADFQSRRLIAIRATESEAKDLVRSLVSRGRFRQFKTRRAWWVELTNPSSRPTRWYIRRVGSTIYGVSQRNSVATLQSAKDRKKEKIQFESWALQTLSRAPWSGAPATH